MKYNPSKNIEVGNFDVATYIATPNAKGVAGHIINGYKTGFHSFNIIGSYGTGKSSFVLAFEETLSSKRNILFQENGQFSNYSDFEFLNVIGDYTSFQQLLRDKLSLDGRKNFFKLFDEYYTSVSSANKFLFIIIDEFGKILEHAAKNNPEEELYFIQQFAEYISDTNRNVVLITTLHQNFSSYSNKLTREQRNEWEKVKGRFKEVVFNEPVEQLLYLASEHLKNNNRAKATMCQLSKLYDLAIDTKFINRSTALSKALSDNIYPIDIFAAYILTLAIQRYGQNERSLFSFLEAEDNNSLKSFVPSATETYNISEVHDYLEYNFYSYLSELNSDSSGWTALKVALERIEGLFDGDMIIESSKLVKTIGLLNIFAKKGSRLDSDFLEKYAENALSISTPKAIIDKLEQFKIIRFAIYKSQYVLFEGSDLDIEAELINAGISLRKSTDFIDKLQQNFNFSIVPAKAVSYQTGTPRFFEFRITDQLLSDTPYGEIDGYVNLIFSTSINAKDVQQYSKDNHKAILYALYTNTSQIQNMIFEIDKYQYVLDFRVSKEDRVAQRELEKGKSHLIGELNNLVINSLFTNASAVEWFFYGEKYQIPTKVHFNKILSHICNSIYSATPIYKNEMLNKHKLTSTMSTARNNYFLALLEHKGEPDLGFSNDKFPPEKSIYKTLLQHTGIYRKEEAGYIISEPNEISFLHLWQACEEFFDSTKSKPRKITELYKTLEEAPFKLKQALCEVWVITYLVLKKEDYTLYSSDKYIQAINKEILDLILRKPSDFSIKAFDVNGVRLDLFNKYREIVNLAKEDAFEETSFIETIRPFLTFYKQLPEYAKYTRKLSKNAIDLRETLAKARDPEETFFVDLPNALGFVDVELVGNERFLIDFVNIVQESIRELRSCYDELLKRIERYILDSLGIQEVGYESYKPKITTKYRNIKEYLLSSKQKAFYSRVMANLNDRKAWINSIAYSFLNKPLEGLLDEEEEWLLEKLKFAFVELSNYVDIQRACGNESGDEVLKFDITSAKLGTRSNQLVIPKQKIAEVEKLEKKLSSMLSSDDQLNLYALLRLIEKKL